MELILAPIWMAVGLFIAYMIDLTEHDTVEVRDLVGYSPEEIAAYTWRFHVRFWLGPIALVYYAVKGIIWLVVQTYNSPGMR